MNISIIIVVIDILMMFGVVRIIGTIIVARVLGAMSIISIFIVVSSTNAMNSSIIK